MPRHVHVHVHEEGGARRCCDCGGDENPNTLQSNPKTYNIIVAAFLSRHG